MANIEESEQIKSAIKEINQQMAAADKRLERFQQVMEQRIKDSKTIFEEKIMKPIEQLNTLMNKNDFSNEEMLSVFKDVIGNDRPELSDLLLDLLQIKKSDLKPDSNEKRPVKKKIRTKIRL